MKDNGITLEIMKRLNIEQKADLLIGLRLRVGGIYHTYLGNGMMRSPKGEVTDVCLSKIEAIELPKAEAPKAEAPKLQAEAPKLQAEAPKALPKGLFGKL